MTSHDFSHTKKHVHAYNPLISSRSSDLTSSPQVRLDTTSSLNNGHPSGYAVPGNLRDMFPQQSSSSPGRGDRDHGQQQQQHRLLSRSFNDYDAQASLPNMYPMKRGASEFPMLTDGRSGSAGDAYVMRGGFKMPRPQIL